MTVTLPAAGTFVVDQPGVYRDLPEDVYHGDPVPGGSLSNSGAKKLLAPSCPAIYRYEADHGAGHKDVFDFGHAAHLEMLGIGAPLAVVDAKDWRTNAAKEAKAAAYAAGETPILIEDYQTVKAMGRALRADPMCAALLDPDHGVAEQSLFWIDDEYGVWRRCRIDWISQRAGRRAYVIDYKSAASIHPDAISKAVHNYGYHQQHPYYMDGVEAVLDIGSPAFLFLFQMKTPPYLCSVVQLDPPAVRLGRERNARALQVFRDCQESGFWPGYSTNVTEISLPRYAEAQWAAEQFEEN
jgi:hypothetical protein